MGGRAGPGGIGLAGQSSAVLHELKVISSSRTRYKPSWEKRAVDVRSDQLNGEYLAKARAADRRQGVREGEVGRVEAKLVSLGPARSRRGRMRKKKGSFRSFPSGEDWE